ncbi:hypothetical protein [Arenimonas donghaensis]|uniref:Uncharacterized protein n=1 Tax=Arenimonas donghaensis DSM 18148 = HO3-R19 TaxID=1121014 RepID=A0A087MFQ1_9GAMM|nr:hypothetical protein [Arenimonas donghaensis]KFL35704.1 hypothetical protein N788_08175 [Arenimonas donghaensis DSM 18148 = HO3-R19]
MSAEKEREYAELNAFVDMYATHFMKIGPADPMHPTNVGRHMVATLGKSKALVGLRQAASDAVEALQDFDHQQVEVLDSALKRAGIVTLTELRRRHSRKYKSILKRGSVRNEAEYYLIAAVMNDCSDSLDSQEIDRLNSILSNFEKAADQSFKPTSSALLDSRR